MSTFWQGSMIQSQAWLVERIGWVLVHSVWQLTLVAVLNWLLISVQRRNVATRRYGLLLFSLALMLALPVLTAITLQRDGSDRASASAAGIVNSSAGTSQPDRTSVSSAIADIDIEASQDFENQSNYISAPFAAPVMRMNILLMVRPWLPTVVGYWLAGILIFSLRPIVGCFVVRRLRRKGTSPVPHEVAQMFARIAAKFHLPFLVQLMQSTSVTAPVVIGWMRPVILLPVAVINGLTVPQLEAVMAHELAHVRRFDAFIATVQALFETIFFFHPAAWWISHQLYREREFCCDDLAISTLNNRTEYSRALLAIAEFKSTNGLFVLGADGGSLLYRIQRLFGENQLAGNCRSNHVFVPLLLLTILVATVVGIDSRSATMAAVIRQQEDSTNRDKPSDDNQQSAKESSKSNAAANVEGKDRQDNRTEPITVSGTVFGPDGQTLEGVHVFMVSSSHYAKIAETVSGVHGKYSFTDVQLPIGTEEDSSDQPGPSGSFEVLANSATHGFTWRVQRFYYPDTEPFVMDYAPGGDEIYVPRATAPRRPQPPVVSERVPDSPRCFFKGDAIKLNLVFTVHERLRMRVVDDTGNAIANAHVRMWNANPIPGAVREIVDSIGIESTSAGEGARMLYDSQLMPPELVVRKTDADGWFEFSAMPSDCEFRIQIAPTDFSQRMIYATTGNKYESQHENIYTDGEELVFPRPVPVTVRVIFADTKKPAPKVWVSGGNWNGDGSQHGSTNADGQLVLNLPPGDCDFTVLPEYKTPYVFVDSKSLRTLRMTVDREKNEPFNITLQRAGEVEVLAIDADTGSPISGADLWYVPAEGQRKEGYQWRSFEQPNVVRQGTLLTDHHGRINTFITPGNHRIGLCNYNTPRGYRPMSLEDAVSIECKVGEKKTVTLKLRKTQ
jgi:beta-lactamase regulating signal transducer with metallopeptidase domain/protocatechuate 3,4-dioxygenase beta subunit